MTWSFGWRWKGNQKLSCVCKNRRSKHDCVLCRYKDIADVVNAGKANGTHTPEDDIMVHKKAHAIVNCYIDSAVSPRVQVSSTTHKEL